MNNGIKFVKIYFLGAMLDTYYGMDKNFQWLQMCLSCEPLTVLRILQLPNPLG